MSQVSVVLLMHFINLSFCLFTYVCYNITNLLNSFLVKKIFPKDDICFISRIQNKTVAFSDITLNKLQLKISFDSNQLYLFSYIYIYIYISGV